MMPPALRDDTILLTPSAQGEVFHFCIGNQGTDLQLLWLGGSASSPPGTSRNCGSTSVSIPRGQHPTQSMPS